MIQIFSSFSMPMLVKFYQSHPENHENPFHPDSDKWELKCVTSVRNLKLEIFKLIASLFGVLQSPHATYYFN